ncbi:PREDICTED: probable low affinity copper uptake protein 2 [Amphimedon queenslandica]|uniref:Copper transport protein n=2 Tax=Amphimedon queenslandica TaxID=400682 RepID=A0A1X7TB70_AMPQE|nr:PREDICTED: probable low affinity copper uptake protein 2 [Amphimedon queenslandica]|eukprot:XP_003390825.1 PREDICTED: probable low affinity copper uptake protein 2 [Amphimedon queenslandica]
MMMNHTGGGSCDLSMDGMSDMDGGSMMGGMGKMYFHFDACQRLLFSSWKITNSRELIGAMVAVILMAILYEGLKTLREWLIYHDLKRSKKNKKRSDSTNNEKDDKMELLDPEKKSNRVKSFSISLSMHIIQSLLHVVQVGYGYILMFIAMTFNGWLFLSVCFGAGIGYFIFGKTKHIFGVNNRDQNEHCH